MTQTPSAKRYDWDSMSDMLFEYLTANPEGVDLYDICAQLEVAVPVGRKAIRMARAKLGSDSKANIITKVVGLERHYVLAGAKDAAALEEWLEFHRKSAQAHLDTVRAVYLSVIESASTKAARAQASRVIAGLDTLIEELSNGQ